MDDDKHIPRRNSSSSTRKRAIGQPQKPGRMTARVTDRHDGRSNHHDGRRRLLENQARRTMRGERTRPRIGLIATRRENICCGDYIHHLQRQDSTEAHIERVSGLGRC